MGTGTYVSFIKCSTLKLMADNIDDQPNGTFIFNDETERLYIKMNDKFIGVTPKKRSTSIFEFKCKNCGASLSATGDESIVKCNYCGSVYDIDNLDNDVE